MLNIAKDKKKPLSLDEWKLDHTYTEDEEKLETLSGQSGKMQQDLEAALLLYEEDSSGVN